MNHISFKDYPEIDKPYEKFHLYGPEKLSDAELLAIILRNGTKDYDVMDIALSILSSHQKSLLNIQDMTYEDLLKIPGIGKVKATQIKCLAQICSRISRMNYSTKLKFDHAKKIADYYMENMRHEKTERMFLLMLDTKCNKIAEEMISKGTVNASLVSPREIFIAALNKNAVYVILVHNHPSGDPQPSKEDILLTKRIEKCGELIGIQLLDHIIIGDNNYTSFKEKNLL